jgi:hypothetical protein
MRTNLNGLFEEGFSKKRAMGSPNNFPGDYAPG